MSGPKLSPQQTRAEDGLWVSQCSLSSLQKSLPLQWPTPPGLPASPKKSYRSAYVYPWQAELADPAQVLTWQDLSDFDLLLRLVDFSGLRPVLAHLLGWKSGRGWEPFDPVSFFLLVAWQIANRWKRSQVLQNLADERYADYAGWFGFRHGVYPSEGGVRYFLTTLGRNSQAHGETVAVHQGEEILWVEVQKLNLLLVEAVGVLRQAPVLSPQPGKQPCCARTARSMMPLRRCAVSRSARAVTNPVRPKPPALARPKTKSGGAAIATPGPVRRSVVRPLPVTERPGISGIPAPTIRPARRPPNTNGEKPAMASAACPSAWPTPRDVSVLPC